MITVPTTPRIQPVNPVLSGRPFYPDHIFVAGPAGRHKRDLAPRLPIALTETGGSPLIVPTIQGFAAQFNGATPQVMESDAISVTSYPFAIGVVFSPVSVAAGVQTLVALTDKTASQHEAQLALNAGVLTYFARGTGGLATVASGLTMTPGQIYHVIGVSFTASSHRLYVNSFPIVSSATNISTHLTYTRFQIGATILNSGTTNASTAQILAAWYLTGTMPTSHPNLFALGNHWRLFRGRPTL